MDEQFTLGQIYEEIAEALAMCRTKALMGDREEALTFWKTASADFRRFRGSLEGYPGFSALEYAFNATASTLNSTAKP